METTVGVWIIVAVINDIVIIAFLKDTVVAGTVNGSVSIGFEDTALSLIHIYIVPDAVDGMNVGGVSRQGGYVGHTCIHICGANGVSHSFILLNHRLMCLAVFIGTTGISTLVEEELGLVEVFLVSGNQIKFGKCHFGNLMSGDTDLLSFACTDFTAYAVGISDGDIEMCIRDSL